MYVCLCAVIGCALTHSEPCMCVCVCVCACMGFALSHSEVCVCVC